MCVYVYIYTYRARVDVQCPIFSGLCGVAVPSETDLPLWSASRNGKHCQSGFSFSVEIPAWEQEKWAVNPCRSRSRIQGRWCESGLNKFIFQYFHDSVLWFYLNTVKWWSSLTGEVLQMIKLMKKDPHYLGSLFCCSCWLCISEVFLSG